MTPSVRRALRLEQRLTQPNASLADLDAAVALATNHELAGLTVSPWLVKPAKRKKPRAASWICTCVLGAGLPEAKFTCTCTPPRPMSVRSCVVVASWRTVTGCVEATPLRGSIARSV